MFGIGETELVIIVVFAFMLFGPDKLPGMGRTLGRVLRQFREASDGFTEVVQTNIMDPASEELEKSPKQRRREEAQREAASTQSAEEGESASSEVERTPRKETFAERRARLAAEREAKKAEAEKAEAEASKGDEAEPSEVSDAPSQETTTAADLYAMAGSRKSSRSNKDVAEESSVDSREEGGDSKA